MNTRKYFHKKNAVPYAVIHWEGPGYYAGATNGDEVDIRNVDHLIDEEKSPYPITRGTGYGTPSWAEEMEDAAGVYAAEGGEVK